MDLKRTGSFIAQCRKEKELTQAQLGAKLNISDKTVSKWETGRGFPDFQIAEDLCSELGITITELMNGAHGAPLEDKDPAADSRALDQLKYEQKTYHLKHFLYAAITAVIVIFLVILIYRLAFSFDIASSDSLERLLSERLNLEEDSEEAAAVKVFDIESIGSKCYVLFSPGLYADGTGLARFERGILGGYRFINVEATTWHLYNYKTLTYNGQPYAVVYGANVIPEAASFKLMSDDTVCAESSMLHAPEIAFIPVSQKLTDFLDSYHSFKYYDTDGNLLDTDTLDQKFKNAYGRIPDTPNGKYVLRGFAVNSFRNSHTITGVNGSSGGGIWSYILCAALIIAGIIIIWNNIWKALPVRRLSEQISDQHRAHLNAMTYEQQRKRRTVIRAVVISASVLLIAGAVLINVLFNIRLNKQAAESQQITEAFVYGGERYSIRDVPGYTFTKTIKHTYVLKNEETGRTINIPGSKAFYFADGERIIYTNGKSLCSCDISCSQKAELFKAPQGNAVWVNGFYENYCIVRDVSVKYNGYEDAMVNSWGTYLIDLASGEASQVSLPAYNPYADIIRLIAVDSGYAYLNTLNYMYRLDISSNEVILITSEAGNYPYDNCSYPGYVSDSFLYYHISYGLPYRVPITGGDPELIDIPYEEYDPTHVVSIFGAGANVYAALDDSTTYENPKQLVVIRISPGPEEEILSVKTEGFCSVIRLQNTLLVTASGFPSNVVKVSPFAD